MGYAQAGFQIVGIDSQHQDNFPFEFIQGNALGYLDAIHRGEIAVPDAIHASPPCQLFTAYRRRGSGVGDSYEDLIAPTRHLLNAIGIPYVIENVEGSPLIDPIRFCGSSFGLDIRRHRLFETNFPLVAPPCNHKWQTPRFPQATNRTNLRSTVEVGAYRTAKLAPAAMEIDWMTLSELSQAIPPAYTKFIGDQLAAYIRAKQ